MPRSNPDRGTCPCCGMPHDQPDRELCSGCTTLRYTEARAETRAALHGHPADDDRCMYCAEARARETAGTR